MIKEMTALFDDVRRILCFHLESHSLGVYVKFNHDGIVECLRLG